MIFLYNFVVFLFVFIWSGWWWRISSIKFMCIDLSDAPLGKKSLTFFQVPNQCKNSSHHEVSLNWYNSKKWYTKDDPTVSLLWWLFREFFRKLGESTHDKQHWRCSRGVGLRPKMPWGRVSVICLNIHREQIYIYIFIYIYISFMYIHLHISHFFYKNTFFFVKYLCSWHPLSTPQKYFCRCPRFGSNDFVIYLYTHIYIYWLC